MNTRIGAWASLTVSLVIAVAWLGCGGEKKESAPLTDPIKKPFAHKRARRAELPAVDENSALKSQTNPLAQTVAPKSLDSFRLRLQEITGKEILSDADLKAKAEAGDVEAQSDLALKLFAEGNATEAFKWQQKSAEQGRIGSQYGMAVSYAKGYGVEPNPVEAVKWFAMAAEQGSPDAQASLAKRYAAGDGVVQDKIEAYKWYDVANRNGRYRGVNPRDKLAETMMPAEIAEAQRRSAAFQPTPTLPVK